MAILPHEVQSLTCELVLSLSKEYQGYVPGGNLYFYDSGVLFSSLPVPSSIRAASPLLSAKELTLKKYKKTTLFYKLQLEFIQSKSEGKR